MKKLLPFIFAVLILAFAARTACANEKQTLNTSSNNYSLLDGIERGFINIFTGWLEVPRGLTYYSVEYPVIGIVPGAFEGAGMTFIRTLGGLVDIVTVGYLEPGNTVYDTMDAPMFPWQSPWLPEKENNNF